jgi:hypothetical protein
LLRRKKHASAVSKVVNFRGWSRGRPRHHTVIMATLLATIAMGAAVGAPPYNGWTVMSTNIVSSEHLKDPAVWVAGHMASWEDCLASCQVTYAPAWPSLHPRCAHTAVYTHVIAGTCVPRSNPIRRSRSSLQRARVARHEGRFVCGLRHDVVGGLIALTPLRVACMQACTRHSPSSTAACT